jgi:hypothetical protein
MTKKQTSENSHFARFLRRFIKRQHGKLKIYSEITTSFEAELSAIQAGESGKAKLEKVIQKFEEFESLKNSFFKYFDKQASTEYAVEDISDRIRLYSAAPKKNLVEILSTTTYEYELMHHEIRYLSAAILFFIKNYSEVTVKEILNNARRQGVAKQRDSVNKQCLEHCLQILKERVRRALKETDYLQFERIVVDHYPTQPAPKKARLTPEEKKLSKDQQEEILKEKQSNKWKPSTLRKFYRDQTGLKASTKK